MKRIREIIMKDIGWKLLSIFIAVALWFTVINIENPIENRNYIATLNFENEEYLAEKGLVITNFDDIKDTTVTIKVRAERIALDKLSQYRNHIQATVDLKKAIISMEKTDFNSLYIDIKLPSNAGNNFEIMSKTPTFLPIQVEKVISLDKKVEAVINGNVNEGYITTKPYISPEIITISGAESLVNSIASVKVNINIKNSQKDVNISAKPIAYDKNGNEIENLTLSDETVAVSIGVNKTKRVPVKATFHGKPLDGFVADSIDWEPKYIDIIGNEADLNNINEILLPVTNINEKSSSFQVEYDTKNILPNGITSKSKIKVNINIIPEITKDIKIDKSKISIEGKPSVNSEPSFTLEDIYITLKGSEKLINNIDENSISGIIDLSNLTEGEHIVEIKFNVPPGVSISGGNYNVNIVIPPENHNDKIEKPNNNIQIENNTSNENSDINNNDSSVTNNDEDTTINDSNTEQIQN